ncbi:MAG TPA: thiosulfate oxidation carrier protein SoxY [Usitatibacter sp.]|jgi:sulfur-oxidizing protein SoxY|nr:thiosulfate oxidation carrier protein SoxY [Usitatibacter sp.]
MNRRRFLAASATGLAASALPAAAQRFQPPQDVAPLVQQITGGVTPEHGSIDIQLPQLAENGNSVPLHITVASPMTPDDHVEAIYVIAPRNPRPLVATFHLGAGCGRAEVATRMRLAGTQKVLVLARLSGGRFLAGDDEVLVTSAACLDESV